MCATYPRVVVVYDKRRALTLYNFVLLRCAENRRVAVGEPRWADPVISRFLVFTILHFFLLFSLDHRFHTRIDQLKFQLTGQTARSPAEKFSPTTVLCRCSQRFPFDYSEICQGFTSKF